jgi:RND superfamily putative drug exporter
VFWVALVGLSVPWAQKAEERLSVSTRIEGAESTTVTEILTSRFHSVFAHPVLLVLDHIPTPEEPEGKKALGEVLTTLHALPFVRQTFSYQDVPESFFLGRGGSGTFVIVGLEAAGTHAEALVAPLRAALRPEAERLRERFPGSSLLVTGEPAVNLDLWTTSTVEARRAEARSLPVTLGLLVLAFGNLWTAAIPLVVGIFSVILVRGMVFLLGGFSPLSILIIHIASMLGLALGIDYALLTVSRFRDSVEAGGTWGESAGEAQRHAGRTVAVSGIAVGVGFAALFLAPLNELRSCALGGLLVVLCAVPLSTTLVPGLLCLLGARVGARFGRGPKRSVERWKTWARWLAAHPVAVLLVALPPLVALAFQGLRLNPRIPTGQWLPRDMEAAEGVRALEAMGKGNVSESVRIILLFPEQTQSLSEEGWAAVRTLEKHLREDRRVEWVQSLGSLLGDRGGDLAAVSLIPTEVKKAYLTEEGDAALLEALPREGVDRRDLAKLVHELREANPETWTHLPGTRLLVGGFPGFNVDYEGAVAGRLPVIVGLVVLGSLCALFLSFRSVLIPVKAVALNLLSVGAACGALFLVFQEGWGVRLLGLDHGVDGVFPIIPPLVFCAVFGLSMDYEVFLVARVREARLAGLDEVEALAEGLGQTGGLITSAASIMVTVFLAFTLGKVLIVKMLGFTLAAAVILDATLVRIAVGPALLRLAGRWNWWPGDRRPPV